MVFTIPAGSCTRLPWHLVEQRALCGDVGGYRKVKFAEPRPARAKESPKRGDWREVLKFAVVTHWVRAAEAQVPPDQRLTSRSGANPRASQSWGYGAGCREKAGRVIEPRHVYSRGQKDRHWLVSGESRRVASGGRQQSWMRDGDPCGTPPGSQSGACVHRGHSGTWERHDSPCRRYRRREPVENIPVPSEVTWSWDLAGSKEQGHRQGIGGPGTTEGRREGVVAVVADHRTDEGGEPRPKAPTGGKERPDMTARRGHQGRHFEATNPVTTTLRIADQALRRYAWRCCRAAKRDV
jgi:hypothetical protein